MDNLTTATPAQGTKLKRSERNGKIELLRFLFSMIIVIFHGNNVMTDEKRHIMFSGRIAVEFFFLVSGYLMAAAAEKVLYRDHPVKIGKECEKFLLRKYTSLYPMIFVTYFMQIGISAVFSHYSRAKLLKTILNSLPCLLLVQQSGVHISSVPTGIWYLSAMLIAMMVIYPLLLRHHDFMKRTGCLLLGLMSLGYLMMNTKNLSVNGEIIYRNIRAVAGLSLGVFSYELAKILNNIPFTAFGKKIIAAAELLLYCIAIGYMVFVKASRYDYYIVFVLLAAITISFSNAPAYRDIFNNRFCSFLGKSSLYIYLSHPWFNRDLTPLIGPNHGNKVRMLAYLALAMLSAFVLWLLSEAVRRILFILKKHMISSDPAGAQ